MQKLQQYSSARSAAPEVDRNSLIEHIRQQLNSQQLGLASSEGFTPVPVSLTPWQLTPAQFNHAKQLAALLGQIQAQATQQLEWLLRLTKGLAKSQTVPGQIWRALHGLYDKRSLKSADKCQAQHSNLMLNRHDFLLDNQQQWRWVESNPIAAGMGPLNSSYLALLRQNQPGPYANNDAITSQAEFLAQGATAMAKLQSEDSLSPLMLIVVDAHEDNIFDQQLLCNAVIRQGVRVERVTVKQLLQCFINDKNQLLWQESRVDLLYWRTGYNPSAELNDQFWHFRAQLEQAAVAQSPTLAGQLTGSKWFQHQFTALLLDDPSAIATQFGLTSAEISTLTQTVVPSFALSGLTLDRAQQLIAEGYWYKTQQEGGGNVARGQAAKDKLANADSADLLMAPIDAALRREAFTSLRQGETTVSTEHISELGIFSLGDEAHYGGYLCRTKPAQNNEGGVHRGGAVLDTIRFPQLTGP